MSGRGAIKRKQEKRAKLLGPSQEIVFVSLDRRFETLSCGHIVVDMPWYVPEGEPTGRRPPKFRRCGQCLSEGRKSALLKNDSTTQRNNPKP